MLSICRTFFNRSSSLLTLLPNSKTFFPVVSCNSPIIHTRDKHGKHGLVKQRGVFDNYWVPRKRALTEDRLTKENQEFLQEVIREKYLQPGESPLKTPAPSDRPQWTPNSVRAGIITRKLGFYPMWTKDGKKIMLTLLQVVDNHVIRYNPPELFSQNKYAKTRLREEDRKKVFGSLVVGAESADPQKFSAAYNGLFAEAGVMPKKKLTRFRITPDAKIEPGTPLFVNHFRVGDHVNVHGITRYHGFQGVVKRWGFKGGPATHGCTKSHRRPGCIGGGRKRGVWKGKKLPGIMGGYQRLMPGLKVWRINTKYNVLFVHGPAVPGINGSYCVVYDCYKAKKCHTEDNPPPFPTFYPEDVQEPLPEDILDEKLHNFSDPSIELKEETEN